MHRVASSCSRAAPDTPSWGEGVAADTWIKFSEGRPGAPIWLPIESSYTVDVRSGETARLDIDLSRAPICRFAGKIRVNGDPPRIRQYGEGWAIATVTL